MIIHLKEEEKGQNFQSYFDQNLGLVVVFVEVSQEDCLTPQDFASNSEP